MTEQDIRKAADLISEWCMITPKCSNCPLHFQKREAVGSGCICHSTPSNWASLIREAQHND